jgi:predicted esterase
LGGVAAARVTLDAADFDVALARTVCLSGAFMAPDPISGRLVTDGLSGERVGSPFTLLHGLADDVVPVTASRDFAAALERIAWPVDVVELAADHGTIAGADYDSVADRYQPGQSDQARAMAAEVAGLIAAKIDL